MFPYKMQLLFFNGGIFLNKKNLKNGTKEVDLCEWMDYTALSIYCVLAQKESMEIVPLLSSWGQNLILRFMSIAENL